MVSAWTSRPTNRILDMRPTPFVCGSAPRFVPTHSVTRDTPNRIGRPIVTNKIRDSRLPIFRALLAKSFLNLVSTRQLLEQLRQDASLRQLCGWNSSRQVPSESVFSRVFSEWSGREGVEQLQASVIAEVYRGRLVGHVIRDATALPARERCRRKTAAPVQRRRRGRPRQRSA